MNLTPITYPADHNEKVDFSILSAEDFVKLYPVDVPPLWWDDASYIRYQTDCGETWDRYADHVMFAESMEGRFASFTPMDPCANCGVLHFKENLEWFRAGFDVMAEPRCPDCYVKPADPWADSNAPF